MKTVVITGSARGFGYAMIKLFRESGFNIVLCDINETELNKAVNSLSGIKSDGKILSYKTDITKEEDVKSLIDNTIKGE